MLFSIISAPVAINIVVQYNNDSSCKFSKLQHNYSLAFVAGLKRATDEGSVPEITQYSPYYLSFYVFTASKGSNLYILSRSDQHCC